MKRKKERERERRRSRMGNSHDESFRMSVRNIPHIDPVSNRSRKSRVLGASIDDRDEETDAGVDVFDILNVLENGLRQGKIQVRVSWGSEERERGRARTHSEYVGRADGNEIEGRLLLVNEGPSSSLGESFAS